MWLQQATEMEWKWATSFSPWQMWGSACYPCERSYLQSLQALCCMLQSVAETVDLGVSFTFNISWNTQMQKVVNKANIIVGSFKRNVGPGNKEVFSYLYKALVMPILGYAVPPWSTYLLKNTDTLERVQRRASKYTLLMSSRDSPYEETLAMLGWPSFQSRRSYLSLQCWKLLSDIRHCPTKMF